MFEHPSIQLANTCSFFISVEKKQIVYYCIYNYCVKMESHDREEI
jgi:hypothetical protein